MDRFLTAGGLIAQFGAVLVVFAVVALSPPGHGRMMLVPITGARPGTVLAIALRNGAGLVGRGPIAGSLIVSGEFSRLAGPLQAKGVALLSAPAGCGEGDR